MPIDYLPNPRVEGTSLPEFADNSWLRSIGYEPQGSFKENIRGLITEVLPYANEVVPAKFVPKINWRK